jgi:hypothetical protein
MVAVFMHGTVAHLRCNVCCADQWDAGIGQQQGATLGLRGTLGRGRAGVNGYLIQIIMRMIRITDKFMVLEVSWPLAVVS